MGYKKGERITDQAVLQRLKKARVKALEVRKSNAARKKKEKELAVLERKKKAKDLDEKLKSHPEAPKAVAPPPTPAPPATAPPAVKAPVQPGPTMVVQERPVAKKKRKKSVQTVYEESSSSSSSSEEEQVVRRRRRKPKAVRRLRRTVDSMQSQLATLQEERDEQRKRDNTRRMEMNARQAVRSKHDGVIDALFAKNYGKRR